MTHYTGIYLIHDYDIGVIGVCCGLTSHLSSHVGDPSGCLASVNDDAYRRVICLSHLSLCILGGCPVLKKRACRSWMPRVHISAAA